MGIAASRQAVVPFSIPFSFFQQEPEHDKGRIFDLLS